MGSGKVLLDWIARLRAASNVPAQRRLVADFGRELGFRGLMVITPVAQCRNQGRVLANVGFDPAWARAYASSLRLVDPLPDIVLAGNAPYRWSAAGARPDLTLPERDYLAGLAQFGMADGLLFPVFGSGARAGVMGYGLHPDLDRIDHQTLLDMHVFVQTAYTQYSQLMVREVAPEQVLSARELEVLSWITQGKSNTAIATILQISPATIDTYARRIFRKLRVTDRVGAALAAVQQGYVIAGPFRRAPEPDPIADDVA